MEVDTKQKALLQIDLRTKLICIVAAGSILVGIVPIWAEWFMFVVAIGMLLNYQYVKTSIKYLILFIMMWICEFILKDMTANAITMFLLLICQVLRKFIPCIILGTALIRTTSISEIMAVSQKMKIPYRYAIPFAVVIRFFPTLTEEWESIRIAMKMRGIGVSIEHILVPLLNSAMRISDELSAASLSRGLGSVEHRTNVCQVNLKIYDGGIMILMVLFLIVLYLSAH